MMNSLGSCFRYFNSLSHKFGDAATDNKNAITRMQSQCHTNIWHVYPSKNVCHINQLWKNHKNYSRSFWYKVQLLACKLNTPVMEMWLYHLFKNIPNMKQKKLTFLHKLLNQMFTNENKYDKLIVHVTVLLEPCRVQHTLFGLNGILQYKEVKMPQYQTLDFLTSQSRADTTDAFP